MSLRRNRYAELNRETRQLGEVIDNVQTYKIQELLLVRAHLRVNDDNPKDIIENIPSEVLKTNKKSSLFSAPNERRNDAYSNDRSGFSRAKNDGSFGGYDSGYGNFNSRDRRATRITRNRGHPKEYRKPESEDEIEWLDDDSDAEFDFGSAVMERDKGADDSFAADGSFVPEEALKGKSAGLEEEDEDLGGALEPEEPVQPAEPAEQPADEGQSIMDLIKRGRRKKKVGQDGRITDVSAAPNTAAAPSSSISGDLGTFTPAPLTMTGPTDGSTGFGTYSVPSVWAGGGATAKADPAPAQSKPKARDAPPGLSGGVSMKANDMFAMFAKKQDQLPAMPTTSGGMSVGPPAPQHKQQQLPTRQQPRGYNNSGGGERMMRRDDPMRYGDARGQQMRGPPGLQQPRGDGYPGQQRGPPIQHRGSGYGNRYPPQQNVPYQTRNRGDNGGGGRAPPGRSGGSQQDLMNMVHRRKMQSGGGARGHHGGGGGVGGGGGPYDPRMQGGDRRVDPYHAQERYPPGRHDPRMRDPRYDPRRNASNERTGGPPQQQPYRSNVRPQHPPVQNGRYGGGGNQSSGYPTRGGGPRQGGPYPPHNRGQPGGYRGGGGGSGGGNYYPSMPQAPYAGGAGGPSGGGGGGRGYYPPNQQQQQQQQQRHHQQRQQPHQGPRGRPQGRGVQRESNVFSKMFGSVSRGGNSGGAVPPMPPGDVV